LAADSLAALEVNLGPSPVSLSGECEVGRSQDSAEAYRALPND